MAHLEDEGCSECDRSITHEIVIGGSEVWKCPWHGILQVKDERFCTVCGVMGCVHTEHTRYGGTKPTRRGVQ